MSNPSHQPLDLSRRHKSEADGTREGHTPDFRFPFLSQDKYRRVVHDEINLDRAKLHWGLIDD